MKQNIAVGIIKPNVGGSGGGNSSNVFGTFQSFSKGSLDCVVNTGLTLEPGDFVHNVWKDINTWWETARYNGGDVADRNNYTPVLEVLMDYNCALPVDAVVSDWSDWSSCVAGSQTRTRTVMTPASGGGNTPELEETQSCVEEPTYCVSWNAENLLNSKMATQGFIDFSEMLAGRTIHTGASTGTITGYIVAGLPPISCEISMEFTSSRATWETDSLPVITNKVLTSLIYTVNIIFTNATEYDIVDGQTNAVVEPNPQLYSSYNSCSF